jgi:hypothetical protein
MSDNHSPDGSLAHVRIRTRAAPLCYTRQQTPDDGEQPPVARQGSGMLLVLGVLMCAAVFLVAFGSWI